jgi:hypothetical protein
MARFIRVDGEMGPEEPYMDLMFRHLVSGSTIRFEHLGDGRQIVSREDVTEINAMATQIAGGKTIYGDAILFSGEELMR